MNTQHQAKINEFCYTAMANVVCVGNVDQALEVAQRVHQGSMNAKQLAEAKRYVRRQAKSEKSMGWWRLIFN